MKLHIKHLKAHKTRFVSFQCHDLPITISVGISIFPKEIL